MFSLVLYLMLFIYPSPTPLHFPPLLYLFSVVSEDNCAVSQRQSFGEGGGVLFRDLLRLTIFFSPQIFLAPSQFSLSPLSCILPLFHSSFCLHRGMNFNHSSLHLRSQSTLIFFPLFPPKLATHSLFLTYIHHHSTFSPYHSCTDHTLPQRIGENKDTDIAP